MEIDGLGNLGNLDKMDKGNKSTSQVDDEFAETTHAQVVVDIKKNE